MVFNYFKGFALIKPPGVKTFSVCPLLLCRALLHHTTLCTLVKEFFQKCIKNLMVILFFFFFKIKQGTTAVRTRLLNDPDEEAEHPLSLPEGHRLVQLEDHSHRRLYGLALSAHGPHLHCRYANAPPPPPLHTAIIISGALPPAPSLFSLNLY